MPSQDPLDQLIDRLSSSGLAAPSQAARWGAQVPAAYQRDLQTALAWLVSQRKISRFHATELVRRPDVSFRRGEFILVERTGVTGAANQYQALHGPTRCPVRILDGELPGSSADSDSLAHVGADVERRLSRLRRCHHPHLSRILAHDCAHGASFWIGDGVTGRCAAVGLGIRTQPTGSSSAAATPPAGTSPLGRFTYSTAVDIVLAVISGLQALAEQDLLLTQIRPDQIFIKGAPSLDSSGGVAEGTQPAATVTDEQATASPRAKSLSEASPLRVSILTDSLFDRRALVEVPAQLDYLAPECFPAWRRGGEDTAAVQVYALGATLYTLIQGSPPFAALHNAADKGRAHAELPVASLAVSGLVPAELDRVIQFALAKKLDRRIPGLAELAGLLQPWGSAPSVGASQTAGASQKVGASQAMDPRKTQSTDGESIDDERAQAKQLEFERWLATAYPLAHGGRPGGPMASGMPANDAEPRDQRQLDLREPGPLPSEPVRIAVAAERASPSRQRAQPGGTSRRRWVMVASGVMALVLAVAGYRLIFSPGQRVASQPRPGDSSQPGSATSAGTASGRGTTGDPSAAEPGEEADGGSNAEPPTTGGTSGGAPTADRAAAGSDDGAGLWASPTAGAPWELTWTPAEAQIVLQIRLAEVLQQPEGERIWRSWGSPTVDAWTRWLQTLGLTPSEVQTISISWLPGELAQPRHVIVVFATRPWGDVPAPWNALSAEEVPTGRLYRAAEGDSLLVNTGPEEPWIFGAADDLVAIAESFGAPPPLRRQWSELLAASDRERHLSLIFSPDFLAADGRELLQGSLAPLQQLIAAWWSHSLPAAMFSADVRDVFYGELRVVGEPQQDAFEIATDLRNRVGQLPGEVRRWLIDRIDPYWQELGLAFPGMITFLHQQTRVGVEGQQAVLNFALPSAAAHNLILATELALEGPSRAPLASDAPRAAVNSDSDAPQTLTGLLALPLTIEIPQHSLEATLDEVAAQVANSTNAYARQFRIQILGEDLRREGITRNQQIRNLVVRGRPLADVLDEIVRRANPVTTVTSLQQTDQKLVWLPAPPGSESLIAGGQTGAGSGASAAGPTIIVTTRAAAQERNWELPAQFQPTGTK